MTLRHLRENGPRLLFVIDNLRPGGAQKALIATVRALRQTQATAAVWRLGGTSEIEAEFDALGVPVFGGGKGLGAVLCGPPALLRYLKRGRIDLVQTLLFHSDVAGRAISRLARTREGQRRRPAIVSSVRASNVRNRRWQFALARLTAPLADAFTAVSERSLDFAARHEGVDKARATVIPNGIDLAHWRDLPERAEARRRLGLDPDAFVVGTVGRLHEQKGHRYLLAAAKRVLAERPDTVFVIAGYGPLRDHLERMAKELGVAQQVQFLGFRRDVPTILAATDVFALPSLWEGMSNAILEAMAAARPVIATEVDGNVEQVVDGETGLLVPAADVEALAEALLRLAADPAAARAMGAAGRRRVETTFTIDRMTDAYLDIYARLLEETASISPVWRHTCLTCGE